jgi:hypothetical protein
MLQKTTLLLCVVFAIVLVGCTKSEPTNNATPTANANKATTTTTPATTTVATAGAKVGVPECDEFLAAYDACVSGKVPEATRAQFKTGMEQWRSSWRKLAENPQTKPTLVGICKQTIETARTSMKAYNCTF